jgi:chromosome segregation ATPase
MAATRSSTVEGRNEALTAELAQLKAVRAELEAAVTQRQSQMSEVQAKQAALSAELNAARVARQEAEAKALRLQAGVAEADARRAAFEDEVKTLRAGRAELQTEVRDLRRRLDEAVDTPAPSLPLVYRLAPWLLAASVVTVLATLVFAAVVLVLR